MAHDRRMSTSQGADIPSVGKSSAVELNRNTIIVVLGASGDLAKKKTFPALFGLWMNNFLPDKLQIVGYARTKMDEEEYRKRISEYIKVPAASLKAKVQEFLKFNTYVPGAYDKAEAFQTLTKKLEELEDAAYKKSSTTRNRIFYMALPPSVFTDVAKGLKENCYSTKGVNRIIVEKPFGKDLESSREMQSALKQMWKEEEIFRIDHYLGKEMVKNILVLRFGNVLIDQSFNKNMVANVQITFKEPFGTEGRGGYFDEFGIIRDVMQNHLCQVLSILTMERPFSFASEDIRDEKTKVLRYIKPVEKEHVLLGQYTANKKLDKPGYLDDDTVPKGSVCPTFAAMVLYINSPRWEGVPFVLKAGKALNEQKTEIRIQYRDVTSGIFSDIGRNELVIRVQPGEAVYLKMNTKSPGLGMKSVPTEMDLTYKRRFSDLKIPEAYEALILDAFKGDHSNFVRDDELDSAWKIFTPLLHAIDRKEVPLAKYEYGSRGPEGLDAFVDKQASYKRASQYSWPTTDANKL